MAKKKHQSLPITNPPSSSSQNHHTMLKLKSFKKIKRMKLKQRFAILGVLLIILFTTRSHWIPHLRAAGFFKGSINENDMSPHAEKHAELMSTIKRHAGHERGDKIKISSDSNNKNSNISFELGDQFGGGEHIDRWENHLEDL